MFALSFSLVRTTSCELLCSPSCCIFSQRTSGLMIYLFLLLCYLSCLCLLAHSLAPTTTQTILAVQVIQYVPPRRTAWIGVELDRAVGDSDGTFEGERLFQCKPQHGVFVREEQLQVLVSSSMGCSLS